MSTSVLDLIANSKFGLELYKRVQYVAYNTTFRTGIDLNADPTAIAATEGMLSIYNSDTTGNTIIVPQYMKLVTKTAAGSGTDFSIRFANDVIERYSSGGSALTMNETYVDNATSFTRRTPKAEIYFGDLTLAAASSEKQVGQATFHSATASQIVGDQFVVAFGEALPGAMLISASAAARYTEVVPLTPIGPGCSLIAQPFETSAATTEANFEVEISFFEIKRGD